MSELLCIGVSHKTAPVEVRERLALSEGRAAEFLRDLRGDTDVHEAVGISTCNRMELYLVVGDPVEAESAALTMLASQSGIRPTELAPAIFTHRNCDAARHLYRVTAGLDSMVVGEAEVQGQVKRAYEGALAQERRGRSPTGCSRRRSRPASGCVPRRRSGCQPELARGGGDAGARGARRAQEPRGGDRRYRGDERADCSRARRQWREDGVRGQPPPRPGDSAWRSGSTARA